MAVAGASKPIAVPQRKIRTPLGDAVQQLTKNRVAVGSLIFIVLLILSAIFADYLNSYFLQGYQEELDRTNQTAYSKQTLTDNNALPGTVSKNPRLEGFVYWWGADNLGRDLYSRTLYGTRVSLAVAIVAGTVSLLIGVSYGLVAGYTGGRVDNLMMRTVDFLYGLPLLIVVILMQVYFKSLQRQGGGNPATDFILSIDQSMGGCSLYLLYLGRYAGLVWPVLPAGKRWP